MNGKFLQTFFGVESSDCEAIFNDVLIRKCYILQRAGDWTGALHDLINPEKKMDGSVVRENLVLDPSGKPIISIDGPFGAASEGNLFFESK